MNELEQRVKDLEDEVAELKRLLVLLLEPEAGPTINEQFQDSVRRLRGQAM